MHMISIAIGVDHRGVELKEKIMATIDAISRAEKISSVSWRDVGCADPTYCDYPRYAISVCKAILEGHADLGILICGTGAGMAIAANRFSGIYAALVFNQETARLAREHDKANVLVLPANFISDQEACDMVRAWLSSDFLGGKYQKRIALIDEIR